MHEATYATFTSNKGKSIDTDFIVGTVLQHIEHELNVQCVWEHLDDDPKKEHQFCMNKRPALQDPSTGKIFTELKCEHKGINNWKITEKNIEEQMKIIEKGREEILRVFATIWNKDGK